jgi:hypothetical protein
MTGILFCVGVTDELAVPNRAAGPGNLAGLGAVSHSAAKDALDL